MLKLIKVIQKRYMNNLFNKKLHYRLVFAKTRPYISSFRLKFNIFYN